MIEKIRSVCERISFFLVVLFVVLLPYDMLYSTIAIYPLILTTLLSLRKEKLRRIPKQFWVFTIIFLLNVIGYVYTTDTWRASYLLERQLTILFFPLLLPLAIEITPERVKKILSFFTWTCMLALAYLFYKAGLYFYQHHMLLSEITDPFFYNHSFAQPIGIHAGYFSIYISLCVSYLLSTIPSSRMGYKLLAILGIVFLSVGLYFLASRNTIISLVLVLLFVFPFFMAKYKKIFFGFALICLASFLIVGTQSEYIYTRFSQELIGDVRPNQPHLADNPEPRIMRWQCAWTLIKERPILGYGSGDEIGLLKALYLKRNMMISYSEEFNTHNQYLSIWIKNGILGLIVFLGMLFYFFYLAIRSKDFVYLSFLIIVSIGFLTENIIDANKGIFYFALFNTLLGYSALKQLRQLPQTDNI